MNARQIVINFETGYDVSTTLTHLRDGCSDGCSVIRSLAEQIEAQTKPPRLAEPSLYGVVSSEDDAGLTTYFWHSHGGWHGENGSLFEWEDLVDPVLVRPGVEDES